MGGVGAVVDVVEPSGRTVQPLLPAGGQALTEGEVSLALLLALVQLPVLHLREERTEREARWDFISRFKSAGYFIHIHRSRQCLVTGQLLHLVKLPDSTVKVLTQQLCSEFCAE